MTIPIEKLKLIFRTAFNKDIDITPATNRHNCEYWDSLAHLSLIVELEDQLNVTFTKEEIVQINSVSEILNVLKNK